MLFSFCSRSNKLAVFPHVVVVFIGQWLGLPPCDKARKPVYENVLHYRVGVRTRLLLAERAGFEPAVRVSVRTLSKRVPSTTQPPLRVGVLQQGIV